MASGTQPHDRLFVTTYEGTAFVHVRGRASFKVGTALKRFGLGAMEAGCRNIVLDMSDCLAMDSTFMGVLAGLAFRLKENGLGQVCLVNLSEQNGNLLATIGLDFVFKTFLEDATPDDYQAVLDRWDDREALPQETETRRATAETILEAHEQLVQSSPANQPMFKDVIAYLREDLHDTGLDRKSPLIDL